MAIVSDKPLEGIFPYLVSPVDTASGRVREGVLRRLVDHLIAEGVHGLSPLGSTGEFAYLSFEQRREIVRIVIDAAAGRVPVVPGVAAYATQDAVRQAKAFEELGADGLVLILQVLFPLSRRAIESYFQTVAETVACPVVVYTSPGLLGGDVTPEMIETLSWVPTIRYVKDASGNTGRILSILNRVGDRLKVFSASAHVPLLVLKLGGVGWMAGPACLEPAGCVDLYHLAQSGQWEEALNVQRSLWPLNELFQKYALAACVKAGLELQGFDVGPPVPPQEPLLPGAVEEIRRAMDAVVRSGARGVG